MHVSVNELMLTSQKAALGAGVSAGAGEDLGNAAVWLGARGFPVIKAVHDALLAAQSGTSVYGKATVNEHRAEWAPEQAGQALSAALAGGVLQVLTQSGMPYAGGKFKFEASRRVEESSDGLENSIPKIEEDKSKTLSGYEVDEILWGKLKQWADLILVEPTTHSRALGAGAGLTDND